MTQKNVGLEIDRRAEFSGPSRLNLDVKKVIFEEAFHAIRTHNYFASCVGEFIRIKD